MTIHEQQPLWWNQSDSLTYYQIGGDVFKVVLSVSVENSYVRMHEIDEVLNAISGTQTLFGGSVILSYRPQRAWLWRQYSGTVFKCCLETTLLSMLGCAMFVIFANTVAGESLWVFDFLPPDGDLPFIQNLMELREIWNIQQTLTTFILTFFVNLSFEFWKSVYSCAREVQGKLSGFNLLLVTNVKRRKDGSLTPEGEIFLEEVAQCTRLFHVLFWASKTKRFSVLITDEGLKRMESRGLMSPKQLESLLRADVPSNQLFSGPLEWMMLRSNQAMDEGVLRSDDVRSALLAEYISLRSAFTDVGNLLDGRMPLAYVQFVQILVDTFVLASPLALYPAMGEYSVFAVGLIALFYSGLNNLAKIFLDPLNNEAFCDNSIVFDIGVIVSTFKRVKTLFRRF